MSAEGESECTARAELVALVHGIHDLAPLDGTKDSRSVPKKAANNDFGIMGGKNLHDGCLLHILAAAQQIVGS